MCPITTHGRRRLLGTWRSWVRRVTVHSGGRMFRRWSTWQTRRRRLLVVLFLIVRWSDGKTGWRGFISGRLGRYPRRGMLLMDDAGDRSSSGVVRHINRRGGGGCLGFFRCSLRRPLRKRRRGRLGSNRRLRRGSSFSGGILDDFDVIRRRKPILRVGSNQRPVWIRGVIHHQLSIF